MFTRLMALNQEAFENRWFDVAYHALAGALHAAKQEHDAEELSRVEMTATTQAEWIDEHVPEYHHSTMSARRRNHSAGSMSIYAMLARQAHAHQIILASPRYWPQIKREEG